MTTDFETWEAPRLARAEEIPRARYLFASAPKPPPPHAGFLVATKPVPVERIVATLAWWDEGDGVKFQCACPPGIDSGEAARALVPALEADSRLAGRPLAYGHLLAEDEGAARYLSGRGYEARHTERVFEAPTTAVRDRLDRMFSRYRGWMPPTWRIEPIRLHPPELVWPVLAPYQLTGLEGLRAAWAEPGEHGYDPDFSCILFDNSSPMGTLLVRTNSVCLAVDVRAVMPVTPKLRALANLALFEHIARLATPESSTLRILAFRAREQDHRETANMAKRMGGREVAVRHIHTRPGGREVAESMRGENRGPPGHA